VDAQVPVETVGSEGGAVDVIEAPSAGQPREVVIPDEGRRPPRGMAGRAHVDHVLADSVAVVAVVAVAAVVAVVAVVATAIVAAVADAQKVVHVVRLRLLLVW